MKTTIKWNNGGAPGKSLLTVILQSNSPKYTYILNMIDHLIYRCFKFKQNSVATKRKFVGNNDVCFNCCFGHRAKAYSSVFKC